MDIKFCGAAQAVTGSAHLITLDDGYTILLDCGLYQGNAKEMADFNRDWLFDPAEIDCLILSHAHIDHSGRIPKLVKDGFRGEIHSTHATRSLASIMLLDSAKIQEQDAAYYNKKQQRKNKEEFLEPLYTQLDAEFAMDFFVGHGYRRWFQIREGIQVMFTDAGHILGSASVIIKTVADGKPLTIGFSGDVGRPGRPILKDPEPLPPVDFLICESTYGDRQHEGKPAEQEHFLEIIENTCIKKGGRVIIPAFSIGRTQEIVHLLDQLAHYNLLPKIKVFVDSPLAVNATTIFGTHPECFDHELNNYLLEDEDPFGFNQLSYIRQTEDSKALNDLKEPCVIISASGMMNAGRVKHHLFQAIENPKNTIMIVGYCTPNTPGGKLIDGKDKIRLFGQWKEVKAEVVIMNSFSAHADQFELLDFLRPQRKQLKKLFLVHGTLDRQQIFQQALEKFGITNVAIPTLGETYLLIEGQLSRVPNSSEAIKNEP